MTNHDKRLNSLYPGLSAQERAILTLADSKEGRPQDHLLRSSAPEVQQYEFNRRVGMINASTGDLAHLILIQREMITQTELRFALFASLRRYGLECARVRNRLVFELDEPITQSTYDLRVKESREELIPVGECAELLADRHQWADEDLVNREGAHEPKRKAWIRIVREKGAQLQALVDDGTLAGRGTGPRLRIACGSFYDWLKEPVPVVPDWGIAVEVFPDDQANEAEGLATRRTHVLNLIDRLAVDDALPFVLERPLEPQGVGAASEELQRMLVIRIRGEVLSHWSQLLTHEVVVDEMSAEFAGEDILHPDVREILEEGREKLIELHQRIQRYTGPFALPTEPDEETLASVRRIVAREVRG